MPQPGAGPKPDTTFYRTQRGSGFDARIEPIWLTYTKLESSLGFFERRRERKKVERVLDVLNAALVGQKANPAGWADAKGECVCHLKVAKMGLIKELKTWLKLGTDGQAEARWPHLHALKDRPCLLIPVSFAKPVFVESSGGEDPLPVASAPQLREELAQVNEQFRVEAGFAIKKMVDYMDATDRDIAIYEQRLGQQEGFWPRFVYVLLKKLADMSVDKKLPAIFA